MEDYRININYAKALFMLATELDQMEAVSEDMRLVNAVCKENHILNVVFNNPMIKETKKVGIVKDLFGEKVTVTTMAFLTFVVKKRRMVNLQGISNSFLDLYRESKNIVLSEFSTAVESTPELQDLVRQMIAQHTGKEVELTTTTDERLLGGFKMSFDNNMLDASMRTRILQLRQEFSKNKYESKL